MADNTTITSANSVFTLVIPGLFPAPVKLEGYSTDRAWATDAIEIAETQMGVDGRMTGGFIFNPVRQTITLQADSPSRSIIDLLYQTSITAREIFYITGALALPSTRENFAMVRGVLSSWKPIPDGGRVLQPVDAVITWERVNRSIL